MIASSFFFSFFLFVSTTAAGFPACFRSKHQVQKLGISCLLVDAAPTFPTYTCLSDVSLGWDGLGWPSDTLWFGIFSSVSDAYVKSLSHINTNCDYPTYLFSRHLSSLHRRSCTFSYVEEHVWVLFYELQTPKSARIVLGNLDARVSLCRLPSSRFFSGETAPYRPSPCRSI